MRLIATFANGKSLEKVERKKEKPHEKSRTAHTSDAAVTGKQNYA